MNFRYRLLGRKNVGRQAAPCASEYCSRKLGRQTLVVAFVAGRMWQGTGHGGMIGRLRRREANKIAEGLTGQLRLTRSIPPCVEQPRGRKR